MESYVKPFETEVLQKFYSRLLQTLTRNLNDVLPDLVSRGVITVDQKIDIKEYGKAQSERAEHLLDSYIHRPLREGIPDNFIKLLKVMKGIPSCSTLATSIDQHLQYGSITTTLTQRERVQVSDNMIIQLENELKKELLDTVEWQEQMHVQDISHGVSATGRIRDYTNINKQVVMIINKYGPNEKQLKLPYLMAKGPNHELMVRDYSSRQVVVFDEQLKYSHVIGEEGSKGKLQCIKGIAANKTYVYVADGDLHCVQKYKLTGQFVSQFGTKGVANGQFDTPFGLQLLQSELLFVCDSQNHRIQAFKNDLFSYCFGKFGARPGFFNLPLDVTLNNTETQLFITDNENHRIQVFTLQGEFIRTFGDIGGVNPKLQDPMGIFFTPDGYVLIASWGNCCILVFKEDGKFVSSIKRTYKGKKGFTYPVGIAMMDNGLVVIADYDNKLVVFQ